MLYMYLNYFILEKNADPDEIQGIFHYKLFAIFLPNRLEFLSDDLVTYSRQRVSTGSTQEDPSLDN